MLRLRLLSLSKYLFAIWATRVVYVFVFSFVFSLIYLFIYLFLNIGLTCVLEWLWPFHTMALINLFVCLFIYYRVALALSRPCTDFLHAIFAKSCKNEVCPVAKGLKLLLYNPLLSLK